MVGTIGLGEALHNRLVGCRPHSHGLLGEAQESFPRLREFRRLKRNTTIRTRSAPAASSDTDVAALAPLATPGWSFRWRQRQKLRPPEMTDHHRPAGLVRSAGTTALAPAGSRERNDHHMRTTTLGTNGPEVGVIGLGCMGMSSIYDTAAPRDEATSISVIHQALDQGSTLIDTADVYGPFTNEELVGRALAGGHRDRAVLATKVGFYVSDPTGGPQNSQLIAINGRPEYVRTAIDDSLRRLGTDHVDLYQLHRVDPEVAIEETFGAMAEAVTAGKVRRLGLSQSRWSRSSAPKPFTR